MRILTLLCGFFLGVLAALAFAARAGAAGDIQATALLPAAWTQLLAEARRHIHADYVDAVDDERLAAAAVRGMSESLDAHSGWLDPGEYAAATRHAAGAAYESAVQSRRLAPGILYLRIPDFNHQTAAQVAAALGAAGGARLQGLVIDLRGNPGGLLDAAAAVADDFLDAGLIVRGEGRTPAADFRIEATPGDLLQGAPLVVLVDGGTASAAEILAGALKDHGRARLVGQRTWGKGTVQTLIPLSRGALRLTTARYFTPAGTSIEEKGIMPDVPGISGPPVDASRHAPRTRDRDLELALRVLQAAATAAAAHPPRVPAP